MIKKLLLEIIKKLLLHSKILSEDDLFKFDNLRDNERGKYLITISPNEEKSYNRKSHFHANVNDVNYFNKSGKKNFENLKSVLTKNKKIEKIIFPHIN